MKEMDGSNDEQIAEIIGYIKSARHLILTCVDEEQRLIVVRKGIAELELPDAMRHFAGALEEMQREERAAQVVEAAEQLFESAPPERKALCPGCEAPVVLMTPLPPPEVMRKPNVKARCVCSCGSFLVPYYIGNSLALRLMSVEEIAETPDEIRNNMLAIRRRMAAAKARRREAN